jgi:hypothetical protein
MSYESFQELTELITPLVDVDVFQSKRRCGDRDPVTPVLKLHCFIRFVAGGKEDIRMVAQVSKPTMYRVIHEVAAAINYCDTLSYEFPYNDITKLNKIALDFCRKSNHGVMSGCVGAIDGFLLVINCPTKEEVDNTKAYFSGHYRQYGINIQAMVDAKCRFMYVAFAAPGSANDSLAIKRTDIFDKIESLPSLMFVVGDNAYTASEKLLVPFSGDDKRTPKYDVFNFHLSQLRIKVEQAFGLLVTKFQILKAPLAVKLKNVKSLFIAMTRIHNFCINKRTPPDDNEPQIIFNWNGVGMTFVPSNVRDTRIPGNSVLRSHIVERIEGLNATRPHYNRTRNN